MADFLEYPDVLQEIRGSMNPGRLKLQKGNVIFKNNKTGRIDQFTADDIRKAKWMCRARGYCLKLKLLSGSIHRFDGFRETEFDRLSSFIQAHYDTSLEKVDVSVRGWNWGSTEFNGNALEFKVNDKLDFEVPLGNVSNCAAVKNEVTLEFHQNDDAPIALIEMRFHIPTDKDADPEKEDTIEEFTKNVLDKADIIQATGDAIAIFSEVQCLTPRGRYDIRLYPSFLHLHGKTFDYKIPYTTILRLFLLPHRDGRQMFFVISLDPPIKQGQTRYHFLILLFNKEDETTLELGLTEEDIQEKYDGKLSKEMQGLEYEIISRLMKTLVNRKITVPGTFVGQSGTNAISCSYKAATGFLYPLERGFIFVHKPPLHIRFDEVTTVNFARSSGNTRSFDFDIDTRSGTTFTFVSIDKDEYGRLYDFVKNKKIRVQNLGGSKSSQPNYDEMMVSDDDDDHDRYLERMKREGHSRVDEDDDDDDESTDEDYQAPESVSEVDEEYDTDAGSSGSSDDNSGSDSDARREKKAKKKEKKRTITVKEPGMTKRKRKRPTKDRDPNKPKRPLTAYFLWFSDNRESIKAEKPGASITDISKRAGELWRELTADDKKKYEEQNAKLKEKYDVAMAEYKETLKDNPPSSPTPKKTKSSKPKSSPAKALSEAYKSKEFISDSGSSDEEDKPLKPKKKKKEDSDVNVSDDAKSDDNDDDNDDASDQPESDHSD